MRLADRERSIFMKKGKVVIKYKNTKFTIPYFLLKVSRPQAETIVYFHGLGCLKEDFVDVVHNSRLKNFSHFAFDFPGSGQASYPKNTSLDFYDLVEITHKVLKKLRINKLILVGHSSGGIVALLYANKYPDKVGKFINVEGTITPEHTWYSEEIKKGSFKFARFKRDIYPKMLEEIRAIKFPGYKKYLESLKHISLRSFFNYRVSHARVSNELSLMDIYLGLSIPTLFISSSKHFLFKPIVRELKKRGAEVSSISKSHHFSFIDNPDEFCLKIEKFITVN